MTPLYVGHVCMCVFSLVLQLICFLVTVTATNGANSVTYWPTDVPPMSWAVSLVWPIVLVGLYELVKRREIKYYTNRYFVFIVLIRGPPTHYI